MLSRSGSLAGALTLDSSPSSSATGWRTRSGGFDVSEFSATDSGGSIALVGTESADAADVEGRAVRGNPQGLAGRYVRTGHRDQIPGQPAHGQRRSDVGMASRTQAVAATTAGEEAEVDFGEVVINLRGEPVTCMLFSLRLSFSGKAHLLIALGTEAAMAGFRVRYVLATKLVNELVEAPDDRILKASVLHR